MVVTGAVHPLTISLIPLSTRRRYVVFSHETPIMIYRGSVEQLGVFPTGVLHNHYGGHR